jgi:uncharacterized phage protein (TIGR01671 family)
MREIRFRAWDEIHKAMYEVAAINFIEKFCLVWIPKGSARITVKRFFDDVKLMQYTGLHDRNGREIWEGDIVHCRAGEIYNGISEYDAVFLVEYGWTQSMWEMQQCETIEVIGNIHDNPDLLPKEA